MDYSDDIVMRYLFGELSEAQRAELETEYFADEQAFNRLERFENDLIDDYARGRLGAQMRARFERAYLSDPNRRERLKFGETLAAHYAQLPDQREPSSDTAVSGRSWWQGLLSSRRPESRVIAFSMAAVLLLLVFGSLWLLIESRRLRAELAQREAAAASQQERAAELQKELADEQQRNQELTDKIQRAANFQMPQAGPSDSATPAFVTLLLTASGVRGVETASPPTLAIPKGTAQVHVQLVLKDLDYQNYQIVLREIAGAEIFNRHNVRPRISKSGATFSLSLPASKFAAGDYLLTLRGALPGGEIEDVNKSLFRVQKQ